MFRFFLGISDGAGGNVMYGYNPRLFSESLMRNCSNLAHSGYYSTSEPKRLLFNAFDRVQNEHCYGKILLSVDIIFTPLVKEAQQHAFLVLIVMQVDCIQ